MANNRLTARGTRTLVMCIIAMIAASLMMGGAAHAQNQFKFHVCNHSRWTASIAVTYVLSRNPDRFMTRGWKNLQPGECSMQGPYPKGRFWYYAFAKDGPQWAGDASICVDKRAGFTRNFGPGEPCRLDTAKFRHATVHTDQYDWTLTN